MHYEDLDYFGAAGPGPGPGSPSEPKDESQIGSVSVAADDGIIGVLRPADTFPAIPEGMYRPEARRSWDRQRRDRRRLEGEEGGFGEGGGGGGGSGIGGRGRRGRGRGTGGGRGGGGGGGGTGMGTGMGMGMGRCAAFLRYCKHWVAEILGCVVGVVCLAVVAAVLKTFDGRGLADWPMTVSLNTLVAFLTAICQVALAVPLTEGLSQLKWNSFARGEKPLVDWETFENAKRGPVGSAVLLGKRKGRCEWISLCLLWFGQADAR
jgi:hypothetical protein